MSTVCGLTVGSIDSSSLLVQYTCLGGARRPGGMSSVSYGGYSRV